MSVFILGIHSGQMCSDSVYVSMTIYVLEWVTWHPHLRVARATTHDFWVAGLLRRLCLWVCMTFP